MIKKLDIKILQFPYQQTNIQTQVYIYYHADIALYISATIVKGFPLRYRLCS